MLYYHKLIILVSTLLPAGELSLQQKFPVDTIEYKVPELPRTFKVNSLITNGDVIWENIHYQNTLVPPNP